MNQSVSSILTWLGSQDGAWQWKYSAPKVMSHYHFHFCTFADISWKWNRVTGVQEKIVWNGCFDITLQIRHGSRKVSKQVSLWHNNSIKNIKIFIQVHRQISSEFFHNFGVPWEIINAPISFVRHNNFNQHYHQQFVVWSSPNKTLKKIQEKF